MSKKTPFRITGVHVLIGFVLFFGLIIAVNIVFISMANRSFPGETVQHAYDKGVRYNETLAAREQAQKLGWNITYSFARGRDGLDRFTVQIADENGPVDALKIEVALAFSGHPEWDETLVLENISAGKYQSALGPNENPRTSFGFTGLATRNADGAKMSFQGRL